MRPANFLTTVLLTLLLIVWLLAFAGFSAVTPAPADGPEQPPPAPVLEPEAEKPKDSKEKDDLVKIDADLWQYDGAEEMHYFTDNVVLSHQDIKLYCDKLWYNEADDTAQATGHLRVVDPESTITGDRATADFDAEVTTIIGNVTVVAQRKKAETEDANNGEEEPTKFEQYRQKKTTITCSKIIYEYGDDVKKMTLSRPIQAVQEDKTAWADKAIYEELKDIVTLTGNVLVKTEKGEEFRSPEVVISVEEEWMKARDVTGITFRRKKGEQ